MCLDIEVDSENLPFSLFLNGAIFADKCSPPSIGLSSACLLSYVHRRTA